MKFLARVERLAALIVPSVIAWGAAFAAGDDALVSSAAKLLLPLWLILGGALTVRVVEAATQRRYGGPGPLAQLDLLTASGRALMWAGGAAIVAALITGWASLAVVGVLGLSTVYVAASWTALAAGGLEPWRAAHVARKLQPEVAVEGDPVREEVTLRGVRIPAGFRLFAVGRGGKLGALSRYVVGADASRAEVRLESELGPAVRGEHELPPLELWLQDVLGLCRSPTVRHAPAQMTALPRPGAVDNARRLLGARGDDKETKPTHRLPSEGTFRVREYAPGDDTRRIHWVRSLQTNQLVVRLPDEIPPDEPAVRLVLDTHLYGTEALSCRAPDELLDAMVRVWLGVGKSLSDGGSRVTLVAAARKGDEQVVCERPLRPRAAREALKLGARVRWQGAIALPQLLAAGPARQVVVSARPRPVDSPAEVTWVVVPEVAWTSAEPWPPEPSYLALPFPIGSADNRPSRRRRERTRADAARRDGALFNELLCWTDWSRLSGAFVARPSNGRVALEVVP
jgi:uncharacterized protein (DUF58 family)